LQPWQRKEVPMRAFDYASPTSKQQAIGLLAAAWGETEVLAGGTDLLALMKDDVVAPRRLVNLKEIKELRGIQSEGGKGLRVGALVSINELAENAQVRQGYRALAQAAADLGSPQIRNMATLGGNLCQRPRCWYFRNGHGLLGKGADGVSLPLEGDNRYHSVLGNSGPAYYVHPSTLAPALIAYGARVRIFGPEGEREEELEKFYRVPSTESDRERTLRPREIVTSILIPPSRGRSATYEVRQKDAFDWPLAMASVVLQMNGQHVDSARIVLGHVAPIPWRAPEAEAAIAGKTVTEQSAADAARAALAGAKALTHNRYKIQVAQVALKRALLQAAGGTV
jgi:xanthine dehydrogenase YagS FAD-binding subunit